MHQRWFEQEDSPVAVNICTVLNYLWSITINQCEKNPSLQSMYRTLYCTVDFIVHLIGIVYIVLLRKHYLKILSCVPTALS